MQNAERGTTLLRLATQTRKDYISAERGVRNAERPHYTTFRSQGKVHITDYLDFEIWMQYATKVKQQRVAVLTYCALKGFCL